jgi:hypothetical protein
VPYVSAIQNTLADRTSLSQLIKTYRATPEGERKCSPPRRVCTSIVERQNLTMGMQMRRLTRLTNGFSKRSENHWAALCLHFAYYNSCRIHRTIRVTPAMQAGIADRVWDIAELLVH